jgi:SAM-dependent methyltransferase
MAEFWESAFAERRVMWGREPAAAAQRAAERCAAGGLREVMILGMGYGRNALPFLERGLSLAGLEISETAIALARSELGLQFPIHHGPASDLPLDEARYDGIFCHGMLYLLPTAEERRALISTCAGMLRPGGWMFFTLISRRAPMYGQGPCLGEGCYERLPGLPMYFYDEEGLRRDFGPHGLEELEEVEEPGPGGSALPFWWVGCRAGG